MVYTDMYKEDFQVLTRLDDGRVVKMQFWMYVFPLSAHIIIPEYFKDGYAAVYLISIADENNVHKLIKCVSTEDIKKSLSKVVKEYSDIEKYTLLYYNEPLEMGRRDVINIIVDTYGIPAEFE